MTPPLPPLDVHAHIEVEIAAEVLESLGAVVFAATRSIAEFRASANRRDAVTVWGLGVHPGRQKSLQAFDLNDFAEAAAHAAVISEIGLDSRARVDRRLQLEVFEEIAAVTVDQPRFVSVHSSGATSLVLDVLEEHDAPGRVLHWWRGSRAETDRALELGCYFSVNVANKLDLSNVPLERLLTETDHPSGNRNASTPRQPGAVSDVERAIARAHGITAEAARSAVWVNAGRVFHETKSVALLPAVVRRMILAASN